MHPYIQWGGFGWPTFGAVAVLALAVAIAYAESRARRRGFPKWTMLGGALLIVGGAWLGARLVPMIVSPGDAFASLETFARGFVRTAGAWYGGLAGGIAGLVFFARRRALPIWPLLDVVAPPLLLSQAVGRFACLAAGCDHGRASDAPWAIVYRDPRSLVDPALLGVPVHPTPVYEALACLVLLVALLVFESGRRRPGSTFLAAIGAYALVRFGIEFTRGDARRGVHFGGALSTSQILSIVAFLAVASAGVVRVAAARTMVAGATLLLLLAAAAGAASDEEALRRAAEALASEDFDERERATRVLADAGEAARAMLEAARRSPDPEARHRAESLLVALAWRSSVTPALEARVPDLARRLASARGEDLLALLRDLHLLGAQEALPALRLVFTDPGRVAEVESALASATIDDRLGFVSALAAYSGVGSEPVLIALAMGPHAILRRGAVEALAGSTSGEARAALESLAKHPDPATAAAATRALDRSAQPPDLLSLILVVRDEKEPIEKRAAAVAALGARGDRRAVDTLVALLREDRLAAAASRALAALRAAEATPVLLDVLGPPDDAALKDAFLFALARCAGLSAKRDLLLVLSSRLASDTAAAEIFGGLFGRRDEEIARAALERLAPGAPGFLAIEAAPLLEPLPDAAVVPVLARFLAADAEGEAVRTLAIEISRRGATGRAALREIAARESTAARPRAAALAALARSGTFEDPDRDLARRFARSGEPLVRGAAVRLFAAVDRAAARDVVLEAVVALSSGRGSFRPGLPDALRALGLALGKEAAARITAVATKEASAAVAAGAVEALFASGDVAAAKALVAEKPRLDSPLRLAAAREIARRGLRSEAAFIVPLLDRTESSELGPAEDGAEPSVFRRFSYRDEAAAALASLYVTDAGGSDPASRAAAWRAFVEREGVR